MTLPRNVRLPRRIRFRNVSDSEPPPALSEDEGAAPPPPAYDDPSHATFPPIASSPIQSGPSQSSLHQSRSTDRLSISAASSIHHRNGMEGADHDRPPPSPLEAVDPNVIALILEDYRRTKEYVRELEWREARRKVLKRHLYKWYGLAIVVITISALLSAKHDTVVRFTEPLTRRIRSWPAGWLIPIAMLVVVSFPPLMGHEIIGILCGLVWGFGEGSGILVAGTFFGEVATWIAFKWFCTVRAKKFEKKNRLYWSLTQLIREKSFMFVLILRFSAVPGHIVTAVSASAGANVFSYCAAAILTLPKQLTITYLGSAFGTEDRRNTIISVCATFATLLMTVVAAVYVYYQMRLLMRRRNREEAMNLPQTVQDLNAITLDMDMTEVGDIGRRRTIHCHRGEFGHLAEKIGVFDSRDLLHSQKPWLFAGDVKDSRLGMGDWTTSSSGGGSMSGRGPQRSRSHPGPLNAEELKAFMTELESYRSTPAPPMVIIDDADAQNGYSDYTVSGPSRNPNRAPDIDGYIPLSTVRSAGSSTDGTSFDRGHRSLDLERLPMGGREIADDADAYAIMHGAKRPTGRGRGESRAALLGNHSIETPPLNAGPAGSRSIFEDEEFEARDVVSQDFGGSMEMRSPGSAKGKEREYGRSRGESGAALLGRPELEEASVDGDSLKGI
ncbi:hypothetical protein BD324DRAFT_523395 [Kockovaella imperatae]|uniref:Golgi apparatus membrane protein TVP38 n=1 Tax=Kockovaella imperatae TaxID=4999 RepID=A0A1Y1UDK7_9TREE|nr:hypothetical protein BD324DRAFT_523395 [Kockovaella imperatae]ORX36092.1 hypothetical protein BD324DRAFT_523395 [Kockovaella imperatae]